MEKEKAFTVMELIVVIGAIMILAAMFAPVLIDYIAQSRIARCHSDIKTLAVTVQIFSKDLGRSPVQKDQSSKEYYYLLFTGLNGDGTPATGLVLKNLNGEDITGQLLSEEIPDSRIDNIHFHLIDNKRGYPKKVGEGGNAFGWDGAYLDHNRTDPWDNPYLLYLRPLWDEDENGENEGNFGGHAVILSLGPNKDLETEIGSSVFLGDDIGVVIK